MREAVGPGWRTPYGSNAKGTTIMGLSRLNDFQINTTVAGLQNVAAITALSDGRLFAVWASEGTEIRGRYFNADGTVSGTDFLVGSGGASNSFPQVVTLADGRYLVSWSRTIGTNSDIVGRIYNADGTAGDTFTFNSTTASTQQQSTIAKLATGGFVATWASFEGANNYDIRARVFAADGSPLTSDFTVNTETANAQESPTVSTFDDGRFVISWMSDNAAGSDRDIKARFFNANGTAIGTTEISVNTTGQNNGLPQLEPDVTVMQNGNVLFTWSSNSAAGSEIRGRIFDSNGQPVSQNDFLVSQAPSGVGARVDVIALQDGRAIAVWQKAANLGAGSEIRARVINSDGTASGDEFTVNSTTLGQQTTPAVALMANGKVSVTWESDGDIRATVINTLLYEGTGLADRWDGGSFGDTMFGFAGTDTFRGFDGNDTLYGNDGNDTLDGGAGNDMLHGGAGSDSLVGGDGFDTAVYSDARSAIQVYLDGSGVNGGEAANDQLISIENIVGTGFNDFLRGNSFSNVLEGGAGADTLRGGAGNDTLIGGSSTDTLYGGSGSDTASYLGSTIGLVVNLAKPKLNNGEARGDVFKSVENIIGSNFRDSLTGNSKKNQLYGEGGKDTLNGGAGNDKLYGGAKADTLDGSSGNDFLVGGKGKDRLSGGSGADKFVYLATNEGNDRIANFESIDFFVFKGTEFGNLPVGTLAKSAFWANSTGRAHDRSDRFILETDTGKLYYDSNGSAAGGIKVLIADVDGTFSMTHKDILII
jgi:Ca2+-binding RTX toxin-like protein